MLEDFLNLALEENLTIEYKREGDSALDSVAALANTYGGLVFYGVDKKPEHPDRPGPITGVNPAEKEGLVNKIATTFDPPWWLP
jgi:predicted HTH transcriptional regulator